MQTGTHIRLVLGRTAKAIERVDRESIADTGVSFTDFSILEDMLHQGPLPINTIGGKVLLTSGSISEDKVGRYAAWAASSAEGSAVPGRRHAASSVSRPITNGRIIQ